MEIAEEESYSSELSVSAATAETTLETTEMTTAIRMINNPPANKKNILGIGQNLL